MKNRVEAITPLAGRLMEVLWPCVDNQENEHEYLMNQIMYWICLQIRGQLIENVHYKKNWDKSLTFNYSVIFNPNDIQNINNFIRINYNDIHQPVINKITYLQEEVRKINNSFYKDACENAKTELFRQKLDSKSKQTFNAAKNLIQKIRYYKTIYIHESPYKGIMI
ncbi:hypothetical protein M9Y10_017590 [Tritrichomonas musculus]|uniref:Uncharacterized protein n=1 Tax=Tritrichomonas musculus TaxID=1915356 RepID=A0ABR2HU96_9EUKA